MNDYNDSIEIWPFGTRSVIVRFHCGNCDSRVESEEISVPMPNYAAEKSSDSYNENEPKFHGKNEFRGVLPRYLRKRES